MTEVHVLAVNMEKCEWRFYRTLQNMREARLTAFSPIRVFDDGDGLCSPTIPNFFIGNSWNGSSGTVYCNNLCAVIAEYDTVQHMVEMLRSVHDAYGWEPCEELRNALRMNLKLLGVINI